MSSGVALLGKFMVFETALSVCFWKIACMRTCHSALMLWATTKRCLTFSGISSTSCMDIFLAIFFINSSL